MNLIVRHSASAYSEIVDFLVSECGFSDLHRVKQSNAIRSKASYLRSLIWDAVWLFRNRRRIENTSVLCIGWTTAVLLLLTSIKLLRPRKVIWWAFFVHSRRARRLMYRMRSLFRCADLEIVVFSETECNQYAELLGLGYDKFHYFLYGDWSRQSKTETSSSDGSYYFSGGYSNRDYRTLIDVFKESQYQLVIAASAKNKELPSKQNIPEHITVELDVPSERFETLLLKSKAVILPFKSETGASGQSVMLRCLRNGKAVIANANSTISEYLIDEYNGVLR